MIVVFYCYSGNHTSVTVANLYLGRLPRHRRATYLEILGQPHFDTSPASRMGCLVPMGTDPAGRPVYCLGLGAGKEAAVQALTDFLAAVGAGPDQVALLDSLHLANLPMRIGGFLSRRLRLVALGRPLVALGVWLQYPRFVAAAEAAQRRLQTGR